MIIRGTTEVWWELDKLERYYLYHLILDEQRASSPPPMGLNKREEDNYYKGFLSKELGNKDYGTDIDKIFIIMICRCAGYRFNVRKRYHVETDEKWIGIDCILDFNKTMSLSLKEQKLYLLQELKKTFTSIQTYKKKLKNFDFDAFENDIQKILDDEIIRIENENK
ncbi:MAG: hypothetical protein R2760_07185 [Chitinophagales bacterium]|nr:hypothetical protein [Bacteroidota bacterium]